MKLVFNIKCLIAVFTLLITAVNCTAQQENNSCYEALKLAEKAYQVGHFTESLELLKPCVGKLEKADVFEAYRLMALCYLSLNDEKMANEAAINLLKHKPDYRYFPFFDPIELTHLLAKYSVWPKLEVGLSTGINFNSVHSLKNYSVTGSSSKYLPSIGYQSGLKVEYNIMKRFSLNSGIYFEGLSYSKTTDNISGWSQTFKEKMRFFNIPVLGRYSFYQKEGLSLAAEIGMQMQMLNSTNSNILHHNSESGERIENTISQSSQRNSKLFYGIMGVALKYKVGGGNVCTNVQYAYGINNVVNADNRYNNLDFILVNQYVDSDFSFNTLYVSLGYQFPIPHMYGVKLK